jgi:puromycin-sensitive aminopeptidase
VTDAYRLPRSVVPRRYELTLEPDLAQATFVGHELVDVEILEPVDTLILNAAELTVRRAILHTGDGAIDMEAATDEEAERLALRLPRVVEPGEARLEIEFDGTLNDQLRGFYRSTFKDGDGVEHVIATTQFESTDARRAFPCWDEPDSKAVFALRVVVPDDLYVVSNTAEVEREPAGEGIVSVQFADSMVMSTYLVALVVGPFEATDPIDVDGIPMRVIAPRGKLHLADFALSAGEFCLRYFADYYGIPYPGDKLDHVAIPDFAFGAMENLGCITYREVALLVDEARSTQAELARVLDVVAHEIAHMWFGDLVTMKWWDGIWLNEAFASFMEMKASDARRPDWKRWLAFAAVDRPWALDVDDLATTRPVEFEVKSPDEANEMFDALTYGKGSSVLWMLEQFIGEDAFRQGVGDYLRQHAYGNTVTADLWEGLEAASEWPVGEIMETWIKQGGYPQIEVEAAGSGIRLRQRRFLIIPDETDQTLWKVPVQLRGEAEGAKFEHRVLLDTPEQVVELGSQADWVVVNAGGSGFYRVSYSPNLFEQLTARLGDLDDVERYGLLDDARALMLAGQLDAPSLLTLLDSYRDEQEQAIWQLVITVLGITEHHLVSDERLDAFHNFTRRVVGPVADRLGWEPRPGEPDLTRRLRGQVLVALGGRLGRDAETAQRAVDLAQRVFDGAADLDPDVALASLLIAADQGGSDLYQRVLDGYRAGPTPQEEFRFLQTLTRFDDSALADQTIAATLDGTIRNQDGAAIVGRLLWNRRSGPDAWSTTRRRWAEMIERFPARSYRRLVDGVPGLSRPAVAADVASFLAETRVPEAEKATAQNLELLRANTAAREREQDRVGEFLTSR